MRTVRVLALIAVAGLLLYPPLFAAGGANHRQVHADSWAWELPPGFPAPRVPASNPLSTEKIELGRYLFFDKRLSGNGTQSCASCHQQARAFTDGLDRAIGSTDETHPRSSMSLTNVAYSSTLTWQDPTLTALEAQMRAPMFGEHPVEMGMAGNEGEILERLRGDLVYPAMFSAAFPASAEPVTIEHVILAIASFERTLISGGAPYFRLVYGDERDALDRAARRGMELFFSDRTRCSTCHVGFTFSGPVRAAGLAEIEPAFHNTGLYSVDEFGSYPADSPGAIEVTGLDEHRGAFRAPTLLNVELTAPYMHDGSIGTLAEVIEFYASGGRGPGRDNPNKSERLAGFELAPGEAEYLVAFLRSLTDRDFVQDPRFSDPFDESGGH